MDDGSHGALAAAIRSGNLKHLEDLHLYQYGECLHMAVVLDAMSSGGCPSLQELTIEMSIFAVNRQADVALARAVESGCLRHVTQLELEGMFVSGNGLHFFEAIKHGGLPELREVSFREIGITPAYGRVLGEAIGSGACPNLRELAFDNSMYDVPDGCNDEGLVHVLEGLEAGRSYALELLAVRNAHLNWSNAYPHLGVVSKLTELRVLNMAFTLVGDESMAKIIEGLATGCPKLVTLTVTQTGMGMASGHGLLLALSTD